VSIPSWALALPWETIRSAAENFNLEPYIIAAIIMAESGGNPNAMRYEPTWRYLPSNNEMIAMADLLDVSVQTEIMGLSTSWGPMQVIGTVAREHGFRGHFPELCTDELGIYYGAKHLDKKFKIYANYPDAVSSYNAGNVRKKRSGVYYNERYVDKVLRYYRELEEANYKK